MFFPSKTWGPHGKPNTRRISWNAKNIWIQKIKTLLNTFKRRSKDCPLFFRWRKKTQRQRGSGWRKSRGNGFSSVSLRAFKAQTAHYGVHHWLWHPLLSKNIQEWFQHRQSRTSGNHSLFRSHQQVMDPRVHLHNRHDVKNIRTVWLSLSFASSKEERTIFRSPNSGKRSCYWDCYARGHTSLHKKTQAGHQVQPNVRIQNPQRHEPQTLQSKESTTHSR